jgi:hypothetical protein
MLSDLRWTVVAKPVPKRHVSPTPFSLSYFVSLSHFFNLTRCLRSLPDVMLQSCLCLVNHTVGRRLSRRVAVGPPAL